VDTGFVNYAFNSSYCLTLICLPPPPPLLLLPLLLQGYRPLACFHLQENMKCTILWDITPCSPLKVNRHLGGASPPSSGSKNKLSKRPAWKQVASSLNIRFFFYPIVTSCEFFNDFYWNLQIKNYETKTQNNMLLQCHFDQTLLTLYSMPEITICISR
jgi:hypothetical protein